MANPVLVGADLSTYTYSATYSDGSYPLTNLTDYYPDTYWKASTVLTSQFLYVDLGASYSIDSVVIDGHNFSSLAADAITLKGSSASNYANSVPFADLTSDSSPSYHTFTAPSPALRYWCIHFYSPGGMSTYPQVATFIPTIKMSFGSNYEWSFKRDNSAWKTSQTVMLDGRIRTAQVYAGRYLYDLTFLNQSDTVRYNYQSFVTQKARGSFRPFYFVDTDGVTPRLVHFVDDINPVTYKRYNLNDIPVKMEELMGNRTTQT